MVLAGRSLPRAMRIFAALLLLVLAAPAGAVETPEWTLFTIALHHFPDAPLYRFTVATNDPDLIARCRAELALPIEQRTLHVNGALRPGHGGFNLPWSWHLDPAGWDLVEVSIELCDGVPADPEADPAYWLPTVGRFCPWASFVAAEGPALEGPDPATIALDLEPIASGLSSPVGLVSAGDGSGRLFVLEQAGTVRVLRAGAIEPQPYLELADRVRSGGEQGLLGAAFHPRFRSNGRLYVNYTDLDGDTVIARFTASPPDAEQVDPATEQIVLRLEQPFANHNGGHLAFGPDGHLWIGTGDGGSANDPLGNAQNGSSLLGKMLRLDIDGGDPYAIPPDNPYRSDPEVRDEIWGMGLRNPWRFSFDRLTGDLWIGDVGQSRWEEVDLAPAQADGGVNWGWSVMEGPECRQAGCAAEGFAAPVAAYRHEEGCSITGGFVARGRRWPALLGVYLFADYCAGTVWGLAPAGPAGWRVAELGQWNARWTSFGEDEHGELYLIDHDGTVHRVRATGPPPSRIGRRTRPADAALAGAAAER